MRNFKTHMVMFAILASLTAAFGATIYHAFTQSVRFYGVQPGDVKMLVVSFVMFSAFVGTSGFILARALDWLGWYRQFKKTFGFKPADRPEDRTSADYRLVESNLDSIQHLHSREKWVKAALLAEKFSFHVQWPPELREEYARTHR